MAPADHRWSAAVTHLADYLVSQEAIADLNEGSSIRFDNAAIEVLGLFPESVIQITEETRSEARKAAAVLTASSV